MPEIPPILEIQATAQLILKTQTHISITENVIYIIHLHFKHLKQEYPTSPVYATLHNSYIKALNLHLNGLINNKYPKKES